MPKKKTGGARRQIRNAADVRTRELVFAEDTPELGKTDYGVVTAVLGDKRFSVKDLQGVVRVAKARGAMRRGQRVGRGDLVLFSARPFEETGGRVGHADILTRYTPEEARKLVGYEEIPPGFYTTTDCAGDAPELDDVIFDDNLDIDNI